MFSSLALQLDYHTQPLAPKAQDIAVEIGCKGRKGPLSQVQLGNFVLASVQQGGTGRDLRASPGPHSYLTLAFQSPGSLSHRSVLTAIVLLCLRACPWPCTCCAPIRLEAPRRHTKPLLSDSLWHSRHTQTTFRARETRRKELRGGMWHSR